MKPTALLVNTSRAELIKPGALRRRACARGRPGKAARRRVRARAANRSARSLAAATKRFVNAAPRAYVERDNYEFAYGNAFDADRGVCQGMPINIHNPDVLKQEHS